MKETINQLVRYGVVGVMNTLITAIVIWVLMKFTPVTDVQANAAGYVAGFINSFVLNKQWTFRSKGAWMSGACKFGLTFLICYAFQLCLLVFVLEPYLDIDSYYKQLIAMAFYTIVSFVLNKLYTFKSKIAKTE